MGLVVAKPFEDDAGEIARMVKRRSGRPTGRKPLPRHLPRERRVIDVPEAEKVCACGTTKVKIGGEVTEKLDYVPASLKVLEIERPCYARPKCHEGVSVAPVPAQAVQKGLAAEGLLAPLVVALRAGAYCSPVPRTAGVGSISLAHSHRREGLYECQADEADEPLGDARPHGGGSYVRGKNGRADRLAGYPLRW